MIAAMAAAIPALAQVQQAAPGATFRIAGEKVPREPERYSGRTAMLANISVHEPKPPDDPDTPFSFSMEGTLRPASCRTDSFLLVAGLEFDPGDQFLPDRDCRPIAGRRSRSSVD